MSVQTGMRERLAASMEAALEAETDAFVTERPATGTYDRLTERRAQLEARRATALATIRSTPDGSVRHEAVSIACGREMQRIERVLYAIQQVILRDRKPA